MGRGARVELIFSEAVLGKESQSLAAANWTLRLEPLSSLLTFSSLILAVTATVSQMEDWAIERSNEAQSQGVAARAEDWIRSACPQG